MLWPHLRLECALSRCEEGQGWGAALKVQNVGSGRANPNPNPNPRALCGAWGTRSICCSHFICQDPLLIRNNMDATVTISIILLFGVQPGVEYVAQSQGRGLRVGLV